MSSCFVCKMYGRSQELTCRRCNRTIGTGCIFRDSSKCWNHVKHEIHLCENCYVASCDSCVRVFYCMFCYYKTCSLCNHTGIKYDSKISDTISTLNGCNKCGGNVDEFLELVKLGNVDEATNMLMKLNKKAFSNSDRLNLQPTQVSTDRLGMRASTDRLNAVQFLSNYMEDKVAEYKGKLLHLKFLPEMDEYEECKKDFTKLKNQF